MKTARLEQQSPYAEPCRLSDKQSFPNSQTLPT
jgi:hypothetical protein